MELSEKSLNFKIKKLKEHIEILIKEQPLNTSESNAYWKGWDTGYFQGVVSTLEDVLIEVEKIKTQ